MNFELEKYFAENAVIEEPWTDIDGSQYIDRFKEVKLSDDLTLIISDDGSAMLTLDDADYTFRWDDEAAAIFSQFEEVRAVDLFGLIYRKRLRVA